MKYVRTVERYKIKEKSNPTSRHSWVVQYGNPWFEVIGPIGLIKTCRTEEKAHKIALEWEEFYQKYPPY